MKIKTKTEYLPEITELLDDIKKYITKGASVVAYLDNEVLVGTYSDGNFKFYNNKTISLEFIQQIRIFNENEELFLWRSNGKLKGRKRIDVEGDETDVIDANQVLFGTAIEKLDGDYACLSEKRGMEIVLPDNGYIVDDKKERVAIKTRNYISYTDNWQATYTDVRFVKFIQLPEEGK